MYRESSGPITGALLSTAIMVYTHVSRQRKGSVAQAMSTWLGPRVWCNPDTNHGLYSNFYPYRPTPEKNLRMFHEMTVSFCLALPKIVAHMNVVCYNFRLYSFRFSNRWFYLSWRGIPVRRGHQRLPAAVILVQWGHRLPTRSRWRSWRMWYV